MTYGKSLRQVVMLDTAPQGSGPTWAYNLLYVLHKHMIASSTYSRRLGCIILFPLMLRSRLGLLSSDPWLLYPGESPHPHLGYQGQV